MVFKHSRDNSLENHAISFIVKVKHLRGRKGLCCIFHLFSFQELGVEYTGHGLELRGWNVYAKL